MTIYPLVKVYGKEAEQEGSYQTSNGNRPLNFYVGATKFTNFVSLQINTSAQTISEFSGVFVRRVNNTSELLDTGYLSSDPLKIDYNTSSGVTFRLPLIADNKPSGNVFRFTYGEDNPAVTIPAYRNLDTTKQYYAKINYKVDAFIAPWYCKNEPCFDYTQNIAFECLVEKK